MLSHKTLKIGLLLILTVLIISNAEAIASQFPVDASQIVDPIDSSGRKEITWDYAVESAEHGFNGTLFLTEKYGRYNLTPSFDAKMGHSDSLEPSLLQDSLSMYKITHNQTYLAYARAAADSLKEYMLNDKGIIRNYSRKRALAIPIPLTQTSICCRLLPTWRCTIPHISPWLKKLPME